MLFQKRFSTEQIFKIFSNLFLDEILRLAIITRPYVAKIANCETPYQYLMGV